MRTIDLYRKWRDACALVEELETATKGLDYGYSPPKVSPLYDGNLDTTKIKPDWNERDAAMGRARRRLKRAEDIRDSARASLLRALDDGED